jgi:hypothetical protein
MSRAPWENLIDLETARQVLWRAKEPLKAAWTEDQKDPRGYPMNTSWALGRIEEDISLLFGKKKAQMRRRGHRKPKKLEQLVPSELVKMIWEDHHAGAFETAIVRAASTTYDAPQKSWKAFKGIMHAIQMAYNYHYWGWETLPMPKVNILHKGLDEIANAAGLEDLTNEGFANFLDRLCPCGLRDHRGAVRQMRRRSR